MDEEFDPAYLPTFVMLWQELASPTYAHSVSPGRIANNSFPSQTIANKSALSLGNFLSHPTKNLS